MRSKLLQQKPVEPKKAFDGLNRLVDGLFQGFAYGPLVWAPNPDPNTYQCIICSTQVPIEQIPPESKGPRTRAHRKTLRILLRPEVGPLSKLTWLEISCGPLLEVPQASVKGSELPGPPNVPLLGALWSLLDGIWGLLKGSWGVLVWAPSRYRILWLKKDGRDGDLSVKALNGDLPGPPKVCKIMAFWAVINGFGPLFCILWGSRYQSKPRMVASF